MAEMETPPPSEGIRGIPSPLFPPDSPLPEALTDPNRVGFIQSVQIPGLGRFDVNFLKLGLTEEEAAEDDVNTGKKVILATEVGPVEITYREGHDSIGRLSFSNPLTIGSIALPQELYDAQRVPTLKLLFPGLTVTYPASGVEVEDYAHYMRAEDQNREEIASLFVNSDEKTLRTINIEID